MLNSNDKRISIQNKQPDLARCIKCKCTWFEQVKVTQISTKHSVTFGQGIPSIDNFEFLLLRCVKCQEVFEPNISSPLQDTTSKTWYGLLDQLDEPMPEVVAEDKTDDSNKLE